MNDKEIRQWYDAHGMSYEAEDWGERLDTGESGGKQSSPSERVGRATGEVGRIVSYDPATLSHLEGDEGGVVTLFWEQREDHEVLAAIEEFFTPYMAMMPFAKRRVLDEYFLGRRTQEDIAAELGIDQSNVSRALAGAVRWVTRAIEEDGGQDAWTVFNEFWLDRFGTDWPLRG